MRARVIGPLVAAAVFAVSGCVAYGPQGQPARIVTVIPTEDTVMNQEVARAEQVLNAANAIGASETHPLLVSRARKHLDQAKAAWKYAYEEEEDELEPDDDEYVAALFLSQEALADAEVALAQTQATTDESRLVEMQRSVETLRNELKRATLIETGGKNKE